MQARQGGKRVARIIEGSYATPSYPQLQGMVYTRGRARERRTWEAGTSHVKIGTVHASRHVALRSPTRLQIEGMRIFDAG